jgi:hypothetical protein
VSKINGSRNKIIFLASVIVIIALLHYLTPIEPHTYHKLHIILRKLYILPPVMAAAWFGLRGACVTALVVSLLFILHAFLDWPGNYMNRRTR